jgi:glycosyltransferase involved in cell wall biosynthesis
MNRIIKKAMIDSVSTVIITKNAASASTDTVNSLKSFTEVIVLDNGPNDGAENIAKQSNNITFRIDSF